MTVVLIILVNLGMWLLYKGTTFGANALTLFLVGGVFQALISWWLGYQYDKAQYYSHKDALTNTYNRRFIFTIFSKLCAGTQREQKILSIMVLDVNQLKTINDEYGHKVGDLAIQHIAQLLVKAVRQSDVVARWGGDEFLVLATTADRVASDVLVGRIQQALQTTPLQGYSFGVTASIGMAVFPDDATELMDLLRIADQRMYKEKKDTKRTSVPFLSHENSK